MEIMSLLTSPLLREFFVMTIKDNEHVDLPTRSADADFYFPSHGGGRGYPGLVFVLEIFQGLARSVDGGTAGGAWLVVGGAGDLSRVSPGRARAAHDSGRWLTKERTKTTKELAQLRRRCARGLLTVFEIASGLHGQAGRDWLASAAICLSGGAES